MHVLLHPDFTVCDADPSGAALATAPTVTETTASPLAPQSHPVAAAEAAGGGGEPAGPEVTGGAGGDSKLAAENDLLRKQMEEMKAMMERLMAAQK